QSNLLGSRIDRDRLRRGPDLIENLIGRDRLGYRADPNSPGNRTDRRRHNDPRRTRRRAAMSIRTRLTIGIALLMALTFAVLGGVIVGVSRATLTSQVDARVLTAATRGLPYGYPKPPKSRGSAYERDGDYGN